jgi:hypothetical protein
LGIRPSLFSLFLHFLVFLFFILIILMFCLLFFSVFSFSFQILIWKMLTFVKNSNLEIV